MGLAILAALLAPALAGTAQQPFAPPAPGTLVTWSFDFDGDKSTRLSEVIASGDDFVIYDPDLRYTTGNPGEYVVEFSGVHAQSCDQALPSESDRRSLRALWPLRAGLAASVSTGEQPAFYFVEGPETVGLLSSTPDAHHAWRIDVRSGEADMTLAVSPAAGMPVRISWAAGGRGEVLEISEPQGSAAWEAIPEGQLGRCAELLQ